MSTPLQSSFSVVAILLFIGAVLMLPMRAGASSVDESDAAPLAEERWHERAYGVSLRPPAGVEILEQTTDGALAHFIAEAQGYRVRVFIGETARARGADQAGPRGRGMPRRDAGQRQRITMQAVKEWALHQVAFANPSAQVLQDELTRVAGRPGVRLAYRIDSQRRGDWILDQAFMQLDPYTFVRFELNADAEAERVARATFNAILASIEVADPQELDQQREQWLEAGRAWLASLDDAQRHDRLVAEQWFRILEHGRDIGYQRIVQERTTELGQPGIRVEIAQAVHDDNDEAVVDTFSEYFESGDSLTEMWSVRVARRSLGARGQMQLPTGQIATRDAAAAETGLRAGPSLTVSVEGPSQLDREQWAELPEVYLSQVGLHLMPNLLPRPDEPTTLAFYAYHSSSGRVALRTFTIVPLAEGGYRVHERPTPEHRERVASYDADGRLLQLRLADGRVIVPSTQQAVDEVWEER